MVIEITPRSKIRVSPLIIIGTAVCVVLAIILTAVYFYFDFRDKKLAEEIQEKKELLRPLEQSISEMEQELIPIKEKIDNYEALITGHQTPLNVYTFFEENTLPNAWFSDFKFDSENRQVIVSGQTDTFSSLGQQAEVFRQSPLVKNLDLTSTNIAEERGGINFEMEFTFKGEIFKPIINEPASDESPDEAEEEPKEDVN
jgi:hypothetical protein